MKEVLVGLALAMMLAVGVAQVAMAGTPPGPAGSKNCIGWCISQGIPNSVGLTNSDFARMHNPSTDGSGCGMTGLIRDANPPQPQN